MKLVVDHVWTLIEGQYPEGIVDKALRFKVPQAWFAPSYRDGKWDGYKRLLEKRGKLPKFPTGLLDRVTRLLDDFERHYEVVDHRVFPTAGEPVTVLADGSRLDRKPYDYQAEMVASAVYACRGTVIAPTGAGKGTMISGLVKSLGVKSLVLVHRQQLLYQTQDVLRRRLGQPVGIIGDGQRDYQDVTVAMVQTIDTSKDPTIQEFLDTIECVVFDECHHIGSAEDQWYRNALKIKAPYRYGFTATPSFEQFGLKLLGVTGPVIAQISLEELLQRGALVPPRVWFREIDVKIDKKEKGQQAYKLGVALSHYRNDKVVECALRLIEDRKHPVILVRQLQHGKELLNRFANADLEVKFLEGKVPQKQRDQMLDDLRTSKAKALVAMVSILGEGVDLPWLRACINATACSGGGTNDDEDGRLITQILGRGSRRCEGKDYFDYIDFVDLGHKSLKRNSEARLNALVELGYEDRIRYWGDYGSIQSDDDYGPKDLRPGPSVRRGEENLPEWLQGL